MKPGVYPFGPLLPSPSVIPSKWIRNWLLAKAINGERASFLSAPDFVMSLRNTRKKQLEMIIDHFMESAPTKKWSSSLLRRLPSSKEVKKDTAASSSSPRAAAAAAASSPLDAPDLASLLGAMSTAGGAVERGIKSTVNKK
jgi:hypothetical protein